MGRATRDKRNRFAAPPWTQESPEWLALGQRLPADHLARRVDRAVGLLDLEPLFASYLGVGKKALPPDLLLKVVVYEMHRKRPSPAQWVKDVRENEPLRWLLFGLEPSRARLYDFRDRLAPFWTAWNAEVLQVALAADLTPATRMALDGSSVAAHASRRQLLNEERLQKRRAVLDEHLEHLQQGEPVATKPGWLAASVAGLREQKQRYEHAAEILQQRLQANAQRGSDKRKPPEKVLVSPSDPAAVLARDKLNVFRPLYTPQLLRDLDSPLIFGFDVFTQNNDNGTVAPLIEQMVHQVGRQPKELFVDSGYVSLQHLEFCDLHDITVYGPVGENDFSAQHHKKKQQNQHTALPKSAFRWHPEEQAYECPQGHRLHYTKTTTQARAESTVRLSLYVCPPEHCQACPRQPECTRTPHKGRTVSRLEHEELVEALRERMQPDAAKKLYKLRSQTVELSYADLKEHRDLRRFHGRGLRRVRAEVGCLVVTHNLLHVESQVSRPPRAGPEKEELAQTPCLT
ncbi:MAG: IS1182 family transposase [Acidobacteria bacterium]|nr:IS1182 family transposase [Acidobacteriota bacterium]